MSALPSYTDIVSLLKKGATIEAQEKIMELREACVALQDENHAMRESVKKLEDALRFKEQLEFRRPFYYAKGDDQPFARVVGRKIVMGFTSRQSYQEIGPTFEIVRTAKLRSRCGTRISVAASRDEERAQSGSRG